MKKSSKQLTKMIRSRKLGFAASFLASLLSFLPISNAELPKPLPNQIVAEYKSSGLDDKGKPIGEIGRAHVWTPVT